MHVVGGFGLQATVDGSLEYHMEVRDYVIFFMAAEVNKKSCH